MVTDAWSVTRYTEVSKMQDELTVTQRAAAWDALERLIAERAEEADEVADATKQVRLRLERAVRSGHGLGAHNALLYADARCNQIEALTLHEVLDELMYEAAYEVTNMTRCP